ncbi:MAG: hypothetical protein JSV94_06125 [Methanobacteriota archaeon]|nr:MAG: hypothetical protein JSV94_06125 [Euryarchaeota archaeon]
MIKQSCQRLGKVAVSPVKYWLLVYVDGKDEEDHQVQDALKSAEDYPPRVKMLKSLREDGTWPISKDRKKAEDTNGGSPYGWTYITMIRNLYWLHDYCATQDDGYISNALEMIFSWQNDEGFIEGPMPDRIPRPYYNGLALSTFRKYGIPLGEQRVNRLFNWLIQIQRHDGGWNIPFIQDVKYLPQYKKMKMKDFLDLVQNDRIPYNPRDFDNIPSCYWSTVGVLTGMSWNPDCPQIEEIRRGGNFVLNGFFKKNHHASFYQSAKHWEVFKYPTYFGSGYWALDSLLYLGFRSGDPRIDRLIEWIVQAREKDGFWYSRDRPHEIHDQWVTVAILMILRYYCNML